MKPLRIAEFRQLVADATSIVTAHTARCPGFVITREVALEAAESVVQNGGTMLVDVYYLSTKPSILIGAEDGRRIVA